MKKIIRAAGVGCILAAVLLMANQQFDFVGRWHQMRNVPAASSAANEKDETPEAPNPYREDIKRWHSANKDVGGWLFIQDVLSLPVVQGGDNDYYLTRDATGAANRNGAAFIDFEVPQKDADNLVIYGHNMENGQVFSNLKYYLDRTYAENHRTITYATEKGVEQFEVLGVSLMDIANERQFFSFNTWLRWDNDKNAVKYVQHMEATMKYRLSTPVSPNDRMLTLSTCDNYQNDARIILVARQERGEKKS